MSCEEVSKDDIGRWIRVEEQLVGRWRSGRRDAILPPVHEDVRDPGRSESFRGLPGVGSAQESTENGLVQIASGDRGPVEIEDAALGDDQDQVLLVGIRGQPAVGRVVTVTGREVALRTRSENSKA